MYIHYNNNSEPLNIQQTNKSKVILVNIMFIRNSHCQFIFHTIYMPCHHFPK